jgi:hypothetical protein
MRLEFSMPAAAIIRQRQLIIACPLECIELGGVLIKLHLKALQLLLMFGQNYAELVLAFEFDPAANCSARFDVPRRRGRPDCSLSNCSKQH